jgi:hypothetical protein
MKINMKKLAAWILAMLLLLQIVPVSAQELVEATLEPKVSLFREKLEVTSEDSIIPVGETVQLFATEGYKLQWQSNNDEIATVNENGLVTAVASGTVKITASEDMYSDSITLRVVDVKKPEESDNEDSEEAEDGDTKKQNDEVMIIVINGDKEKVVYDGEEHTAGFTATSNSDNFDVDKVEMINPEKTVTAKDCGVYTIKYEPEDFVYDGSAENVEFIVSNGWLQIKPAVVTVKLGTVTKKWGEEDPNFKDNLIVEGLIGDDTVDMLGIEIKREEGEEADFYSVSMYSGKNENSNYRVVFTDGVLVIEMPTVKIKSSMEGVKKAPAGTEVVMTAEMEGLDPERFNIQWQMGDTPDVSTMENIEGANEAVYTYKLSRETSGKYFRVLVTLK